MTIRRLDGTSPWRGPTESEPSSLQTRDVFGSPAAQRNAFVVTRAFEDELDRLTSRTLQQFTLSLLDWTF
ncbi:MAG: hypothetical protein WBV82_06040 [Myxococcaceae bacterium]